MDENQTEFKFGLVLTEAWKESNNLHRLATIMKALERVQGERRHLL